MWFYLEIKAERHFQYRIREGPFFNDLGDGQGNFFLFILLRNPSVKTHRAKINVCPLPHVGGSFHMVVFQNNNDEPLMRQGSKESMYFYMPHTFIFLSFIFLEPFIKDSFFSSFY